MRKTKEIYLYKEILEGEAFFLYQGMRTVRKKLEGRLPTEIFNVVFVLEPCDYNYIFKDKVTTYTERSQSFFFF